MTSIADSVRNPELDARFLAILKAVLPGQPPFALHEPLFDGNEWTYVKECIDTGWVSSVGKFVDEFERRLCEVTRSRYAIATVNGTTALHIALKLAGVQWEEEVLVPALSFVATANAVAHCGAIPHFVDSDERTLGLDAEALRDYLGSIADRNGTIISNRHTGRRLAAIVPMHTFGHPVDMDALLRLGTDFGIPIIEDAAESLGSLYCGQHMGTFGMLGTLSFNGNKIITTGGGGAILTQHAELARHAKHISTTAKLPHRWEFFHDEVAWNFRLPNLNAALGCAQLEKLDVFLASKRELAARYRLALSKDTDLYFADEPPRCRSNFWLNTAILRTPSITTRDRLLASANDAGFMARPAWTLLNRLPMYTSCPTAPLPVAEKLAASIINLPSSPSIAIGTIL